MTACCNAASLETQQRTEHPISTSHQPYIYLIPPSLNLDLSSNSLGLHIIGSGRGRKLAFTLKDKITIKRLYGPYTQIGF